MLVFGRNVILALLVISTGVVIADDASSAKPTQKKVTGRKFATKPLLRVWFRLDEREVSEYIQSVMQDYEVESAVSRAMENATKGATERPELQGMLVLLAKGIIPVPVQLQFVSVADEKEFHRLIMRAKNQLGSIAKISGNGDHYTMDMDFSKGIPMFGSDDGDDAELFELPGIEKMRDNPAVMAQLQRTIHFRLDDGLMWQGELPEIMEMDLPSIDELQPPDDPNSFDMLAEFNLHDIPFYMKSLLFNTLNVAAKTQLQQRDGEDQLVYDARRSNGDFWLELLRTAVYDVEKGKLSIRFAEGDRPIRVRLDLDSRKNSNLEKVGKVVGGEKSRFASIRNRPAPMTIASTFGLPEQSQKLLQAVCALTQRELGDRYQDNEDTVAAIDKLHDLISDTVESGKGDGLLQVTGDVTTGFAVVGGIRIQKPDQLRDGLDRLLSSLKETNHVERSVDDAGRRYVSLDAGEVPVPGSDTETFMSEVHLTAFNSCLWFAYGGPSSRQLLEESIVFADENRSGANRTHEPFQFALDLSQWLEGDDEDEDGSGFNQLPRRSLLNAERKFDAAMGQLFSAAGRRNAFDQRDDGGAPPQIDFDLSASPGRSSMLLKAIEQGGDTIDLRVKVSKSGINLDMEIGLGIANMMLARGIDVQGRAMEMLMQRQAKNPETLPEPSGVE